MAGSTITDYKKKTCHITLDTDVLLPDKLNAFFEDSTVPLTRPDNKDCGLPLSFSVADVSKTFKCVNPRKAASPDGILSRVLRACAD